MGARGGGFYAQVRLGGVRLSAEEELYDLAQMLRSGRAREGDNQGSQDGAGETCSVSQQLARHRMLADALVHLGQAFHLPERVLSLLASAAAGDVLDPDQIQAISITSPRPSPVVQDLMLAVARILDPEAFMGDAPDPNAAGRRRAALDKAWRVLVILGLAVEPTRSGPEGGASA